MIPSIYCIIDPSEGVMHMSVKERIMMLRLMEKLRKHPDFAARLGVEASSAGNALNPHTVQKGLDHA